MARYFAHMSFLFEFQLHRLTVNGLLSKIVYFYGCQQVAVTSRLWVATFDVSCVSCAMCVTQRIMCFPCTTCIRRKIFTEFTIIHDMDTHVLYNDLIRKINLNMAIRGYTSLSNIRFGHAVTWATALHLATGALANRKASHTGCQIRNPYRTHMVPTVALVIFPNPIQ